MHCTSTYCASSFCKRFTMISSQYYLSALSNVHDLFRPVRSILYRFNFGLVQTRFFWTGLESGRNHGRGVPSKFSNFYFQRCENGKKSKKSNQTKSLAFNHWSLGCKTRERSKLVKTKPTIIPRIFTKSPQYFTKNGINSNMDAIFRSMKITNERLDENGRIFIDQSELRIFYSYLEILSHFRWQ